MARGMEAFRPAYDEWGAWIILIKGMTPIPYKIVTIASGFAGYNFFYFVVLSLITRGARFFLEAELLRIYGEPIRGFIEKRLTLVTTAFLGWSSAASSSQNMRSDMAADFDRAAGRLMLISSLLFTGAAGTVLTAHAFEIIGGYLPCHLCLIERYAYYFAVLASIAAFFAARAERTMSLASSLLSSRSPSSPMPCSASIIPASSGNGGRGRRECSGGSTIQWGEGGLRNRSRTTRSSPATRRHGAFSACPSRDGMRCCRSRLRDSPDTAWRRSAEPSLTARARYPSRDNRASSRADSSAGTAGRCGAARTRSAGRASAPGHIFASAGSLPPFLRLHGAQAVTTLSQRGLPAARARHQMVEGQVVAVAAILAGEAVAQEHVEPGEGRVARRPDIGLERDDARQLHLEARADAPRGRIPRRYSPGRGRRP